jgi:hypothetical protein
MEAQGTYTLKSLAPYRHLFPKATGIDHTEKKGATVSDTVHFIPKVVKRCLWMVRKYVDQELRGLSVEQACRKLWYFVKEHIEYEKDDPEYENKKKLRENFEQVKSPRRLIADGKGDCDCMTTFVNCCMTEYGVKGIINRITEYNHNGFFQHIYSLIPDGKGTYIIMDCVWTHYNKEKPYTKKEDYIMELQFLDGIGDAGGLVGFGNTYTNMDSQDLFGDREEFGELGKLFRKKTPEQKQIKKEKRQGILKKARKAFNVVNKVNPATAILRAGILASMKLNIMKVPETLKWGYASRERAQSAGMDMSKYDRLQKVREKIEKIFFSAGGKPENLRKAILTGRGNRNKEVSGFGELSEAMSMPELLGATYDDEFVNGMEGFEGFGSLDGGEGLGVATSAAVAAATTVMGTIAALLKSIGNLFPNRGKKGKAQTGQEEGSSEAYESSEPEPSQEEISPESALPAGDGDSEGENLPSTTEDLPAEMPAEEPQESEATDGVLSGIGTSLKTFYQAHKTPIKIVGGIALLCGAAYLISRYVGKNKDDKEDGDHPAMNGIPKREKNYYKKKNTLAGSASVIELM